MSGGFAFGPTGSISGAQPTHRRRPRLKLVFNDFSKSILRRLVAMILLAIFLLRLWRGSSKKLLSKRELWRAIASTAEHALGYSATSISMKSLAAAFRSL
jgi:hypothetical protein